MHHSKAVCETNAIPVGFRIALVWGWIVCYSIVGYTTWFKRDFSHNKELVSMSKYGRIWHMVINAEETLAWEKQPGRLIVLNMYS